MILLQLSSFLLRRRKVFNINKREEKYTTQAQLTSHMLQRCIFTKLLFFFFLEKMIRLKAIWTVWCLTQPMPMRKTLKWQTLKELWMTGQSGMWLAGTGEPRCTGRGGSQYVYMAWGAKKSLNLLTRQIHPENLFRRLNYFFRLRYIWATWTKRCVSEKEAVD